MGGLRLDQSVIKIYPQDFNKSVTRILWKCANTFLIDHQETLTQFLVYTATESYILRQGYLMEILSADDQTNPTFQVCVQDFCEELEYWGLDDLHMEPCCQHTYYRARWLLPQPDPDVRHQFMVAAIPFCQSYSKIKLILNGSVTRCIATHLHTY